MLNNNVLKIITKTRWRRRDSPPFLIVIVIVIVSVFRFINTMYMNKNLRMKRAHKKELSRPFISIKTLKKRKSMRDNMTIIKLRKKK